MPTVIVDIEVFCSCGESLCNVSSSETTRLGSPTITVEPCKKCMAIEREAGHTAGYELGDQDGYTEGYEIGFGDGQNLGNAEACDLCEALNNASS